uniref:DOMON domain-containing protein n=1 Tax=Meloidogyne hapla TaxID=6305 RepID=A0A1I8BC84_MELHA
MGLTVDWKEQIVEFTVYFSPSNLSAVLIGFSDHGKFEGNDFCIYQIKSGKLVDGWLDQHLFLHKDIKQDCHLMSAKINKNDYFRLQRKFATCDPRDFRFDNGTTNIILAASPRKDAKSLKDMIYEMRYTKLLTIGLKNTENKVNLNFQR